jgi:hypothetical protein
MEKNPKSRKRAKMKRRVGKSNVPTSREVGQSDLLRKAFERSRIDESGAEIDR